jgi:hypothetical protein
MSWINKHQRYWRIAALALMGIGLIGPWFFELTWVPPPYFCSAPHIRLDETFCGMPYSIISFFCSLSRDFSNMVAGSLAWEPELWSLLFFLFLLLLVLPFFSTLVLVLRGERRRQRIGQTTLLGLAIAASTLIALLRPHWSLWGVWLYICAAATMLLLEIDGWRKQETHA